MSLFFKKYLMKKIIIILFLAMAGVTASAQFRDIPAAVTEAFKQKFPDASNVSWKDGVTSFEASFKMNNHDYTANFSKDGKWKRTEKSISYEVLPQAVQDGYSKSKYSGWKRGSVAEVDDYEEEFHYRIFVEKNVVQKKFLYFDRQGKLVKDGNVDL